MNSRTVIAHHLSPGPNKWVYRQLMSTIFLLSVLSKSKRLLPKHDTRYYECFNLLSLIESHSLASSDTTRMMLSQDNLIREPVLELAKPRRAVFPIIDNISIRTLPQAAELLVHLPVSLSSS